MLSRIPRRGGSRRRPGRRAPFSGRTGCGSSANTLRGRSRRAIAHPKYWKVFATRIGGPLARLGSSVPQCVEPARGREISRVRSFHPSSDALRCQPASRATDEPHLARAHAALHPPRPGAGHRLEARRSRGSELGVPPGHGAGHRLGTTGGQVRQRGPEAAVRRRSTILRCTVGGWGGDFRSHRRVRWGRVVVVARSGPSHKYGPGRVRPVSDDAEVSGVRQDFGTVAALPGPAWLNAPPRARGYGSMVRGFSARRSLTKPS